jgi:hypothetical protein
MMEGGENLLRIFVSPPSMSEGALSPKTISDNYVPVVKMVVASAVDEQGEELYPRKWNHEFIDLPIVEHGKQNTPCFSAEVMTGLARWKKPREQILFCAVQRV